MQQTDFVADFDSASAMLRATAAGLRRDDFSTLGVDSPLDYVAGMINRLPDLLKEQVYIWSGADEAVDPEKLGELDEQAICRAFVGEYEERSYPSVMIGSSNGAGVHLATAIDAPWSRTATGGPWKAGLIRCTAATLIGWRISCASSSATGCMTPPS